MALRPTPSKSGRADRRFLRREQRSWCADEQLPRFCDFIEPGENSMNVRNSVCIVAIAIAGSSASIAAADEMFLKFTSGSDPILGDSADAQHPNEIVLLSYSLGVDAESSWT